MPTNLDEPIADTVKFNCLFQEKFLAFQWALCLTFYNIDDFLNIYNFDMYIWAYNMSSTARIAKMF